MARRALAPVVADKGNTLEAALLQYSSMLRDHVEEEVGRKLRKLGFRKKGNTWRRESDFGIASAP
jgi:hypothetical protein